MTTIATDGRTMAGDGRLSSGCETISDTERKVYRLDDGRVIGVCGCAYAMREYARYMQHGGDKPVLDDSFRALMLHPDGRVEMINHQMLGIDVLVPNAIGSGADYAMGAMLAGASPMAAVMIAAMRDQGTGGAVIEC